MIAIEDPRKRRIMTVVDAVGKAAFFLPGLVRRTPELGRPRRILVIRVDHIGDALLATPVFKSLRRAFPSAELHALIAPWSTDIYRNNPNVDEVITVTCPWWGKIREDGGKRAWLRSEYPWLLRKLKKAEYDAAVDLRGDFRQMLLFCYLPGARVRVGLDRSGGAYLLTHPVAYDPNLHEVEKNFACIEKLGVTGRGELPELFPSKGDEASAEKVLKECGAKKDGFILVTPGARVKVKSWPENKYMELGRKLAAKYGVKILLAGSKGDGAVCSAIAAGIGKDANDVSGRLGLLALRCMMDRARLVLGSDSGTMHIAATSKTPIVCLFGPTDPVQYRPYTDRAILVQNKMDCSPCLHVDCDLTDDGWGKCMHSIEVGQVMDAVEKALAIKKGMA